MKPSLATRFRIIGIEVIGLGAFTLLVLALSLRHVGDTNILQEFVWDYAIISGTLILLGLELYR